MEVINIEINSMDKKDNMFPLLDTFCQDLNPIELLDLQNKNIFTGIAKEFLSKMGYNQYKTFVVMEYINNDAVCEPVNMKNILVNKDGESIANHNICIVPLTNNGYMFFYDDDDKQQLLYTPSKIGECVLITKSSMSYYIKGNKFIKFSYLTERPNIDLYYQIYDNVDTKTIISTVKPEDFLEIQKGIEFVDDEMLLTIHKYICLEINNEKSIYKTEKKKKKKLIIPLNGIRREMRYSKMELLGKDNENISLISEESCPLIMNNGGPQMLNIYNMLEIKNKYYKLHFENTEDIKYIQSLCRSININANKKFDGLNINDEKNLVFINKLNLTNEEKFILNISKTTLYECMNIKYNMSDYDIAIEVNGTNNSVINSNLIYSIILTFDSLDEEEIIIINETPIDMVLLNHIYIYNPEVMSVIRTNNCNIENNINKEKYIRINIYNSISSIAYKSVHQGMCSKEKYKKSYDDVDKCSSVDFDKLKMNYTRQNTKFISTSDNKYLQKKYILPIYKKYLHESRSLHFCYVADIVMVNEEKNDNVYKIYNLQLNKKKCNELKKIKHGDDNIIVINNVHESFIPVINIFKSVVVQAIEQLYGENKYLLNIKRSFIMGNKEKNDIFNSIYCDLHENINKNMIIYASINIEINSDNFGEMILYTNYVNYLNKNYNNRNTLEFIIETVDTTNDIMSIEEQRQLIEFANINIEKIKNIEEIPKLDNDDKKYAINPFTYEKKNGSWDMYSNKWDGIDDKIKNIIKSIRQRIIEKENFKFKDEEPSNLPSFFQILRKGSATHYHIDSNDEGTYHIRFNVIIQKAEEGGDPIYNGIIKQHMERQYVMCRSGIDYHSSNAITGNKPRVTISYGFNIPKDQISNYPNIFGDLIKND